MDEGTAMTLVIITIALVVAGIFILNFYYRYRARSDAQATIRVALEKGQSLTPELLVRLMDPTTTKVDRHLVDLRRGVIAAALGLGIAAIGSVMAPTWQEGAAVGALPFVIGVAYIALWKLGPRG